MLTKHFYFVNSLSLSLLYTSLHDDSVWILVNQYTFASLLLWPNKETFSSLVLIKLRFWNAGIQEDKGLGFFWLIIVSIFLFQISQRRFDSHLRFSIFKKIMSIHSILTTVIPSVATLKIRSKMLSFWFALATRPPGLDP